MRRMKSAETISSHRVHTVSLLTIRPAKDKKYHERDRMGLDTVCFVISRSRPSTGAEILGSQLTLKS